MQCCGWQHLHGGGYIVGMASFSPEVSKPASKLATIKHILTDSDPRSLGIDGISSQLRDILTNILSLGDQFICRLGVFFPLTQNKYSCVRIAPAP